MAVSRGDGTMPPGKGVNPVMMPPVQPVTSRRPRRGGAPACALLALAWLAVAPPAPAAAPSAPETAATRVRVLLPEPGNLQWLNFWVARGAGLFADEGLDTELVLPPQSGKGAQFLVRGQADVAVMPRPMYLNLIARGQPLVVFANLLRNDPINLAVRAAIARERGLSADLPLRQRLEGLRGLRVGVAPGPPPRLRALFESAGLAAEDVIDMVIVRGPDQNEAFAVDKVDALYAHTPYLEHALVGQDAVLLVNQSAGEVPSLADRQIHALVTTRAFAAGHADVLTSMVRAIHRAQRLIHADREAAVAAVRTSGAELAYPEGLETLVGIYQAAVPETPEVSIEKALRELALFPEKHVPPELDASDLAGHVDNRYAEAALAAGD